jgi:hypothetical protein
MSSNDSLIVPFGQYKGKHVTELVADKKYIDWLKSQPGLLEKYPTINNIIVHQTIVTGGASKTPEHNKLQNLFLSKEFQVKFLNHMSPISKDVYEPRFNEIYESETYKKSFGEKRFDYSKYNWDLAKISVEFEGIYNWDVSMNANTLYESFIGNPTIDDGYYVPGYLTSYDTWASKYNTQDLTFTTSGGEYGKKNYYAGLSRGRKYRIEIKPTLGDDYPAVLRKMKTQIELTKKSSGGICGTPVLLVGKFESESATLDQLKAIFKQTDIKVVLLDEILKSEKKADVPKYVSILEEEYLHMKKKLIAYESKCGEIDV